MGNSAFYLKYRPQTLNEIIGQESVKKTLLSSFENEKLSHAYLFVGPRGSGKTSTARILAKMVNCCAKQNVPCNKCEICTSITDGSNMDLIEIDAASNRGIEDIRSLRDKIKLVPSTLKKKVYIIDEVHMLTTEAFNALLKTLEEPPKHALFILATTELGKIPHTILSRVQRLDFKLASTNEISEVLSKIIKEEKIDIDEEALKILVRRADGSFRDGVKFLDQVSSLKEKITAKSLLEYLKTTQFDDLLLLLKSFSAKNATESLLAISKQQESGVDIKELIISLMETLRGLVFIKNGLGEQLVKHHFVEDKYGEVVDLADNFSNQELVRILEILQAALEKLKFTSIPSLPLELAIVEICDENSKLKTQNSKESANSEEQEVSSEAETTEIEARGDSEKGVPTRSRSEETSEDARRDIELAGPRAVINDNTDILKLKEKWTFVLETIRAVNFSLEALLRSIKVAECSENTVIMEVPYSFHQRILEAPKNRELLEGVLSDILGRAIRISTILGKRPEKKEDIANIDVASDDEIIRAAAEIFNSDPVN